MSNMRTGKIVMIIFGAILAIVAVATAIGGSALLWANAAGRNGDGYFTTPTQRFDSATYAITSKAINEVSDKALGDWLPFDLGTARISVTGVGEKPLFIGVAKQQDVDRYLSSVAVDQVADISGESRSVSYKHQSGTVAPQLPVIQTSWLASASGSGTQTVQWDTGDGDWVIVAMNADASSSVAANASAAINSDVLLPIGIALLAIAFVLAFAATALLVIALRGREPALPVQEHRTQTPHLSPVHFRGVLEPNLSRGMW